MLNIPRSKYAGLIIGLGAFTWLLYLGRLSDYDEGRYHDIPPDEILAINKIKFEESSKAYGIADTKHEFFFPHESKDQQRFRELITIRPSVSVFDFNEDGYMDVFYTVPQPEKPSRLFLNQKGERFIEVTDQYPFLADKDGLSDQFGLWADFTNDGRVDYFAQRMGCHALFEQLQDGSFQKKEGAIDYCSVPNASALLDFNMDGNLDVFLGNYFSNDISEKSPPLVQTVLGNSGRSAKGQGGKNAILLGDGKGHFQEADLFAFDQELPSHTQGAGVAYIDDDHWPDLFVANDYYYDEMYLNFEGRQLNRVTDEYIPRNRHGWSGMNSEFADYNMDGKLDLYVSNAWVPPSGQSTNLLWTKRLDGSGFQDEAQDLEVFKCGWAWGAKFSDYDLDGDLDLFVTNGRTRGEKAKSFSESRSFNYLRLQIRSMPHYIRYNSEQFGEDVVPSFNGSDFQLYGFERNCVFLNHNGKFYDVAEAAGVEDLENGISVAKIDVDNDGLEDVLIANSGSSLLLYKNISDTQGNWAGLSVVLANGQPAHGAKVTATRSDGKPLINEIFVLNGYRGQNDPRIHYGLGKHSIKGSQVTVLWPDGKEERFANIKLNQYNEVTYGTGQTVH